MASLFRRRSRRGTSDQLTGLATRALFESRFAQAQLRAQRHQYCVGVLAIDVDELASVNNTMGRACGDRLLQDIAGRLTHVSRNVDTVARMSSDEFVVLLEQVDSPTGAARAAQRILDAFTTPVVIDGREVPTSLSIGISVDEGGAASSDQLLGEAGIALARAKARGKRRFETFEPPMGVEASARLTLEAELGQAVAREQILIHYQPVVDIRTGAVAGAEALARWLHPERGLLYPTDFIPAAESSGAIHTIGRFVLREACRAGASFARTLGPESDFVISVNVSARQLHDGERLVADVADALQDSGLRPAMLGLEITESCLLDDVDGAGDVVRRLRATGVKVALDDFGTGYSSLAYVKKIPVSGLKIDCSFVADLADPATAAIVRAVLGLAAELDITVTAEGAETEEAVAQLRAFGCHYVQGFHYCEALPEAAFARLLMQVPRPRLACDNDDLPVAG
jgi:diguanylate cyclase (GGDEF)-like protein